MSEYLPQPTDEQSRDIAATEQRIRGLAPLLHSVAVRQSVNYRDFWNRSPERILAELSSNPPLYLNRFIGNTALNTQINSQLDKIGDAQFPTRAPTSMPPGWAWNGSAFTYTPPVVEEPAPLPPIPNTPPEEPNP